MTQNDKDTEAKSGKVMLSISCYSTDLVIMTFFSTPENEVVLLEYILRMVQQECKLDRCRMTFSWLPDWGKETLRHRSALRSKEFGRHLV